MTKGSKHVTTYHFPEFGPKPQTLNYQAKLLGQTCFVEVRLYGFFHLASGAQALPLSETHLLPEK